MGHTLFNSSTATLDEWLTHLEQLHPAEIELGLERIREVASQLEISPQPAKVITVAGTNGKGSTVKYLETILQTAGYQTGVYVSPHLRRYNERVRINTQELDDAKHCQAFAAVEQARGEQALTYFEFGTLAAFWLMQQQPLDVWILEVGLGGRLDAVNIIDADVAVLTSVGLDHMAWLGDTREAIGFEKAGVFRAQRPAICGDRECPQSVVKRAEAITADLLCVGQHFDYERDQSDPSCWYWRHKQESWLLPLPQLPLPNAATAIMALFQLRPFGIEITQAQAAVAMRQARLAGRLEYYAEQLGHPAVLLDVGHNPHATEYLAKVIQERFNHQPIIGVVGMLKDKDIDATLAPLMTTIQHWHLATLNEPRGASAERLASALPVAVGAQTRQHTSVQDAFYAACTQAQRLRQENSEASPLVFVFGSFYTVAKVSLIQE